MRRLPRATSVILAALLLLSLAVVSSAPRAHADESWCWDDPVVLIGINTVSINLGVKGSPSAVRSAVVDIYVPKGTPNLTLLSNTGQFPAKVTVKFIATSQSYTLLGSIPVTVHTTINTSGGQSVQTAQQVSYTLAGLITTGYGLANRAMTSKFSAPTVALPLLGGITL